MEKKIVGMFMNARKSKNGGFTLIEILVVIGIIALLATIVIVAINPARQFAQARNTQRTSNVNTILNAVGQRIADNKGVFQGSYIVNSITYTCGPLPTTNAPTTTITTDMAVDTTTKTGKLGCLTPTYIPSFPADPTAAAPATDYEIIMDGAGRVTVCAPNAATETSIPGAAQICVTR